MRRTEINSGGEGGLYTVFLTVADPVRYENARASGLAAGEGEGFIAALLSAAPGAVAAIERFRDGLPADGPQGQPYSQEFDEAGRPLRVEYRPGGKESGRTVVQTFAQGRLQWEFRFRNGRLDGQRAVQGFGPDGTLKTAAHFAEGQCLQTLKAADLEEEERTAPVLALAV